MAKLRKMFGELNSDEIQSLMKSIESQSEKTIYTWTINYAYNVILPIFESKSDDLRPRKALEIGLNYIGNRATKSEVRELIKDAQQCARDNVKDPVLEACSRAIAQSVATIHKQTNSLALAFYGSAAIVYYRLGLEDSIENYNIEATKEILKMEKALKEISIENEPNKAKLVWNC